MKESMSLEQLKEEAVKKAEKLGYRQRTIDLIKSATHGDEKALEMMLEEKLDQTSLVMSLLA